MQSFRDETYSSFPSQPTPHNTVEADTSCSPWCSLKEVVNLNVEHIFPQLCFEWEVANCLLLLLFLYVWPAILNFEMWIILQGLQRFDLLQPFT